MCTTTFATLRWTNTSPGASPTIWFAGTRLSEQPIQRYSGDCRSASPVKKSGSRGDDVGRPGAVALEELGEVGHAGDATAWGGRARSLTILSALTAEVAVLARTGFIDGTSE